MKSERLNSSRIQQQHPYSTSSRLVIGGSYLGEDGQIRARRQTHQRRTNQHQHCQHSTQHRPSVPRSHPFRRRRLRALRVLLTTQTAHLRRREAQTRRTQLPRRSLRRAAQESTAAHGLRIPVQTVTLTQTRRVRARARRQRTRLVITHRRARLLSQRRLTHHSPPDPHHIAPARRPALTPLRPVAAHAALGAGSGRTVPAFLPQRAGQGVVGGRLEHDAASNLSGGGVAVAFSPGQPGRKETRSKTGLGSAEAAMRECAGALGVVLAPEGVQEAVSLSDPTAARRRTSAPIAPGQVDAVLAMAPRRLEGATSEREHLTPPRAQQRHEHQKPPHPRPIPPLPSSSLEDAKSGRTTSVFHMPRTADVWWGGRIVVIFSVPRPQCNPEAS